MSRVIDLLKIENREIAALGWNAAKALGSSYDSEREGIRVRGAGMDMGFHLVYNLSATLFPDGFDCVGDGPGQLCRSNDHSNGDRDYTPHRHKDGGYALKHRWL